MAPKFDATDPEVVQLIDLFQTIGFTKAKATETCKNPKIAASLKVIIEENGLGEKDVGDKKASLISHLAVKGGTLDNPSKNYIVNAILDDRLKSTDQVTGMSCYLTYK
jgi:glutaminyl-tRNA synthetase